MNTYYFTYGSEGHPFVGGWTEIIAPNATTAIELFRFYHPDKKEGLLNCCCLYNEDEFFATGMHLLGNLGAFCLERIVVRRQVADMFRKEGMQA